jgi:hypothetical protein
MGGGGQTVLTLRLPEDKFAAWLILSVYQNDFALDR